jgi:hypothetical protein
MTVETGTSAQQRLDGLVPRAFRTLIVADLVGSVSGATMPSQSPLLERQPVEVPAAGAGDVDRAADAAERAFPRGVIPTGGWT